MQFDNYQRDDSFNEREEHLENNQNCNLESKNKYGCILKQKVTRYTNSNDDKVNANKYNDLNQSGKINKFNFGYNQSKTKREQENYNETEIDRYLRNTDDFGNLTTNESEAGKIKNKKVDFKQSLFEEIITKKIKKTKFEEMEGIFFK